MGKQLELLLTKAQLKDQEIEEVTRELDAADKVRCDKIVSNLRAVVLKNEQNVWTHLTLVSQKSKHHFSNEEA